MLKRFKYHRDSYLLTILLLGIVVMFSYISANHFFRIDLTENQQYAISDASKNIMKELDDIVTIKVFFSEELPPNLFVVRQYVQDMLAELSSYGDGNLLVRFMDPSDEMVSQEALTLGIPQVRMNILAKDKFEVKNGFLGIALLYGDRHEIIPVIQSTQNLEYEFVTSIKKLVSQDVRRVGFTVGHGEFKIKDTQYDKQGEHYGMAIKELEKNYLVTEVDLSEKESLSNIHTLIVGGPRSTFSDEELYLLDQYIMLGGNVVFVLDSIHITPAFETEVLDIGLNKILSSYGLTINPYFALDVSNETTSFSQGFINFIVPYPFWVKVTSKVFDITSPIVSKIDSIIFPWTSPITLSIPNGVTSSILAKTTPDAWLQKESFNLDPNIKRDELTKGEYILAVLLSGNFPSAYADQDDIRQDDFLSSSDGTGHLIAIGNARFLTDNMVRQHRENLTFFLNSIDYLTLDDSLIDIRSKMNANYPLKELSDNHRQLIKFLGILLMPLLVIIYGVFRFLRRRHNHIVL